MKKVLNFLNVSLMPVFGILMVIFLFSACKKNDVSYASTSVAGLMAFNLSTDQPAIGVSISGNNLTNTALGFTSYTGLYLPVYTGTRSISAFDYNTGANLATTAAE